MFFIFLLVLLFLLSFINPWFFCGFGLLLVFLLKKKNAKINKIVVIALSIGCILELTNYLHRPSNKQNIYVGVVIQSRENYILVNSRGINYYISSYKNDYETFDVLKVSGKAKKINFITLEGQFDFNKYLYSQNTFYEIESKSIEVMYNSRFRIKKISEKFLEDFDDDTSAILGSLMFNQKNDEITSQSLFILFQLSSLHLLFILGIIEKLVEKYLGKSWIKYISLAVINIFFLFSNYKLCFLRLLVLKMINIFKPKFSRIESISLVFLIFLIVNPYYMLSSSFLYSSLILFSLPFLEYINKSYKKYAKIISYSVIQFIVILLSIYYNFGFYPLSIILQIMLYPFVMVEFTFGILYFIFPLPKFFIRNYSSFLYFIENRIKSINPFLTFGKESIVFFIICSGLFFIALSFLELKQINKFKYSMIILISFFALNLLPVKNYISQSITFINVGQGDSILIQDHLTNILIDTGGQKSFDLATECLIPYLHRRKISKLDLVLISHDDYDHDGALASLKSNFKVKKICAKANFYSIDINSLHFINLNYNTGSEDNNSSSQVLYLEFINRKFLFMGDAPKNIEQKIMNENPKLHADVLKVGHHGSDTSSSKEFLEFIKPQYAVISVGKNNKYGHPNQSVIDELNQLGIKIYRTDVDGSVTFKK